MPELYLQVVGVLSHGPVFCTRLSLLEDWQIQTVHWRCRPLSEKYCWSLVQMFVASVGENNCVLKGLIEMRSQEVRGGCRVQNSTLDPYRENVPSCTLKFSFCGILKSRNDLINLVRSGAWASAPPKNRRLSSHGRCWIQTPHCLCAPKQKNFSSWKIGVSEENCQDCAFGTLGSWATAECWLSFVKFGFPPITHNI